MSFGAWNGIAQSCGSGARALAPTIFGSAFAAAYAADLPEHLPFLVLCATCAIACVCVMRSGADGGRLRERETGTERERERVRERKREDRMIYIYIYEVCKKPPCQQTKRSNYEM